MSDERADVGGPLDLARFDKAWADSQSDSFNEWGKANLVCWLGERYPLLKAEIDRLRAALAAAEAATAHRYAPASEPSKWQMFDMGPVALSAKRAAQANAEPARSTETDPMDDPAWCGVCGHRLTVVRPGKWQCDHCQGIDLAPLQAGMCGGQAWEGE